MPAASRAAVQPRVVRHNANARRPVDCRDALFIRAPVVENDNRIAPAGGVGINAAAAGLPPPKET
ncbi:MAG: hypothetical protein B7Z80_00095 [Rhodospirillales bacterium 20-64-7]|nr:MAG: hypothetical protein B7Z80_00095 [Rhodospirillales bacterium 20-64-7]